MSTYAQSWQDVGGGTSNSSHGMLTYDGKLINLGSFNNTPCDRVAAWDGSAWSCFNGGVGIVARAGVVWDGKLVVVGDFWNNFQPCVGCNGIAVWDGSTWSALDQGFNNDVLTVTVYNGDLIVGGDFTEANGVPCSRVVRWNTTTSTFESMGLPTSFDNDVRCMVEFNGELYVGGDFNNVDGNSPSDGLVKWDVGLQAWTGGNSGVDLVGGVNETVRVLYVNPNDGNLYMGGHFPELIDGDSINPDYNMSGVAMYDGSNWFPLGTGLNDYCRAIHEYNGNLIVGGYFTTADGVACNKIAKWVPGLQTFTPMGLGFDGIGVDEYVKSAEVWNGIFFAGGAYTQAEGGPMNYIAQWYEVPTTSPTASFTASSTNDCEGACINFTDASTNAPTSWAWTFPGSSTPTSTSPNPLNICYPTAGSYTAKLVACNGNGCDSTTINITINTGSVGTPSPIMGCDSVLYNSVMYYTSTMVNDTAFGGSSNGCDSITNQQIILSSYVVATPTTIFGCDSVLYNSTMYYTSTMVNDTIFGGSSTGCDSITNQQITINNFAFANLPDLTGCNSVLYNSVMYYSSTTVSDTIFGGAASGCDSITNQPIIINNSVVSNQPDLTGCNSVLYNSVLYYNSTTVSDTIFGGAANGCDSITNQPIIVNNSVVSNQPDLTGCNNVLYNSVLYYSSTTVSDTIFGGAANGCDSITNQPIIITSSVVANLSDLTSCDSLFYNSQMYYTSTTVSDTSFGGSANGCDSITNQPIIISNSVFVNQPAVIECDSAQVNGVWYYTSQTVSDFYSNGASNGCDSTDVTVVTINSVNANTTTAGYTITATAVGATYQWLDCNNAFAYIVGETNQMFTATVTGDYAVEVTMNGCTDTSACEHIIVTGINNIDKDQDFKIYPNPTKDIINIITSINNGSIEIIDVTGKHIVSFNNIIKSIDVSDFSKGVYFLKMSTQEGVITRKFIKQ
jgi:PKD repeat protein